jgi:SAM-dependent methyltransferase
MKAGLEAGFLDRACPLCGSRDESSVFAPASIDESRLDDFSFSSRKTPEYMHCRLIECRACDLIYASPAPTPEVLAAAYRRAAFAGAEESGFAARTYGRVLDGFAGRLPNRDGALDIGTGDGAFLEEVLARGFARVEGVEPSEAPIASARAGVRPLIRRGLFSPGDFKENAYSLVTSFQTLEHVTDPLELVRGARRLLKEGGATFFVCHDRRALSARVLGRKSPIFDIEHLQLFSPRSARRLLEQAGFSRIEIRPIGNRYPLKYWLRLLPLSPSLKRVALALAEAARVGDLPLSLPAGNMAAVGYKIS